MSNYCATFCGELRILKQSCPKCVCTVIEADSSGVCWSVMSHGHLPLEQSSWTARLAS